MKSVYRLAICVVILVVAGLGAASLTSRRSAADPAQPQKPANAPAGEQSQIEHGRYIVQDVAMCSECHTPRDANGDTDNSRYLQGAAIWITPVHPTTSWGMRAPALAGFEGFTEEQGEQILEKGSGPNGLTIQPPMHIYHMSHADAQAVIAYLRSLSSAYPQAQ
jgi:mono/diheme cytochrome c family protein